MSTERLKLVSSVQLFSFFGTVCEVEVINHAGVTPRLFGVVAIHSEVDLGRLSHK